VKSTSAVTTLTPIVAKLIYSIKDEAPECLCNRAEAVVSASGGFWGTDGAVRFDDGGLKDPVGEVLKGAVGLTYEATTVVEAAAE
jgi:hypothetical protein